MYIAISGGTGDIGEGFALRLLRDTDHDVVVGSVAELAAEAAPSDVSVVGAFQNLAAGALTDLDNDLGVRFG